MIHRCHARLYEMTLLEVAAYLGFVEGSDICRANLFEHVFQTDSQPNVFNSANNQR